MSKKISIAAFSLMLALAFAMSAFSVSPGYEQDHPGWSNASGWALPELGKAYDIALIPRTLLGVDMTKNITRAQFAALAVQLYEILTGKSAPAASADTFSDTGLDFVLQAYRLEIVNGVGNGKFDPFGHATREDIAAMLCRTIAAIVPGTDIESAFSGYSESFPDAQDVSDYAATAMIYMVNNGFMKGSGGMLLPKSPCTREQAICLVYRIYELLSD